ASLLRKSIVETPADIVRDGWLFLLFKTCASAARLKIVCYFNMLYILRRIKWTAVHAGLKGMRSNNELRIEVLNWEAVRLHTESRRACVSSGAALSTSSPAKAGDPVSQRYH